MFDMLTSPYTHPLKRLIWMRLKAGAKAVWDTISGNPVSFSAKAAPLRQLSVAFSPVQSGSGDPSPDNVRPISGWSEVTVYHSGADTSDPRSISISLGQTVYSGYVDVVTGVLTVDMAKVVYSGQAGAGQVFSSVAKGSSSDENYTGFLLTLANNIYENSSLILSQKALNNIAPWYYGNNNQTTHFYKTQAVLLLFIPASVATTVDEFKTYSASNSVEFVLPLAEPIPIQLTPQEVQSLLGENVLFSDANGNLTVEYRSN